MSQNSTEVRPEKKRPQVGPTGSGAKTILILRMQSPTGKGLETRDPERVFKFDKDRIVIGSVVSADVRVTGEGISPIHAVLEVRKNQAGADNSEGAAGFIFDLASLSGVFVNGKKVLAQALQSQDKITIGRYHFKYSIEILEEGAAKKRDRSGTRETEGRLLFIDPKEDLQPLLLQDDREIEEIFDFRPTSKLALEVVMSWYGSILAVEHFVNEKRVTIGNSPNSNFSIPPLLSSAQFPVVSKNGGDGFVLNLDAQMKGVIQQNGELSSITEARSHAVRGANGYEVPLGNQDFAKITIGEIDFYFSYTSAPPRLKRRRLLEKDPFFTKVFSVSMLMTVALLYTLSKVQLPQAVDVEQMPERIATILYQPEKFMKVPEVPKPKPTPKAPEPVPTAQVEPPKSEPKAVTKVNLDHKTADAKKPIPKVMAVQNPSAPKATQPVKPTPPQAKPALQNRAAPKAEAKEGEGARAKGAEGSRGEPNQKRAPVKSTELSRPSPNGGTKGAKAESQVEVNEDGNVDLLKGAGGRIQNILGSSSANLGDGGSQAKGFGNFSSAGNGGLALSGSGRGGGGTADTTLGGLGQKGRGMGRVGTGMGAAGHGSGIVGAHSRVELRSDGPEEAVVMGSIDQDAVSRALDAHRDEFRLCYEREINAENPSLSGKVGVKFVIGASGHVSHAGVESSALNNPNAENCILKVIKRIQFPVPQGGGIVEVSKTFTFAAIH
jgi:hypothetical protein